MQAGTRFWRAIPTALLFACVPAIGLAGANPSTDQKIVECSARNSEPATVVQIAANPDAYEGRCVVVEGTIQRSSLFASVDGVYLQPPDSLNPASSGLRIGLDNVSRHFSESYRSVSIVGRVQDCEAARDCLPASAAENEIVMITGYCHYHNGPYLQVRDLRFRHGPPFQRRMGSYARSDYGDLVPAPDGWPYRAKVTTLAGEFLQALQSNDRDKLAYLHFRNVGLNWEDDEEEMLRFLLKDRHSPFGAIRTSAAPPQQIVLVERSRLEEDADDYTAIVCFCREKNCTSRWPIATFDADNLSTRPYACTGIAPYLSDKRMVPHFTTNIGKEGLAEPDTSH